MLTQSNAFVGIDLGTSGLRGVVLNTTGAVVAQAQQTWTSDQNRPEIWKSGLDQILHELKVSSQDYAIRALSVCSTSGSIIPVDQSGQALGPALLYCDPAGREQAQRLGIPTSWGLAKWLWWQETYPDLYPQSFLAHPSDFLLVHLGAESGFTDHNCALKSGFDPAQYDWSATAAHNADMAKFPKVIAPGTVIGQQGNLLLVAGTTDGCAGQLATGAVAPGQVCTSLGTTLIFKGVSLNQISTADGTVYSHLHPDRNSWLPGAASSCGGVVLGHFFPDQNFALLDEQAQIPSGQVCYPLAEPGERFPILDPEFAGFLPKPLSYAALLEGVAFVERLGLERLAELGVQQTGPVYTTGGGCRSPRWLKIRASVLNRSLVLPARPEPAMGAAVLAAAGYWKCSVQKATERLIQPGLEVKPESDWVAWYAKAYQKFKQAVGLPEVAS
ncbi:FGGY-family carbohydrate kinase [Leptolyngbya sp. FACHB-261]|uniref:FGGY-family carbohydrate kinase n=1 Tax=Leptolyngbya sp. FACHB-261 TaxID=2692806 RepID=UPI0016833391|nr:FGGY-family carbohydrate kinase [Leptolyngbya sp. FACHB-261]MBD2101153.1 FGGY-family carbohydrate kinase [Leptolyngbya sp. FACHB-261]